MFVSGGAHVGLLRGCEDIHLNIFGSSPVIFLRLNCILSKTGEYEAFVHSFPGCELSSKVPFYTFQGDEDDDLEHFLELRTVCTVVSLSLSCPLLPNGFYDITFYHPV